MTVRTAVPSGVFCDVQYESRSDARDFVAFALGGSPPEFADSLRLLVAGSMPRTFLGDEAADKERWGEAFDLITAAAGQSAPTTSGMPALRVVGTMPPDDWCGVPRPGETDGRFALRVEIDPRATGEDDGCPLTIDLYRVQGVIDLVVVYGPKRVDGDEAVSASE